MLAYYTDLALRSLRRSRALTVLMVLALGLGIGASMTTLTVFHALSGDPLPERSAQLHYVQLDAEGVATGGAPGGEPFDQLTRFDAETLLREKRADRQALMTGGSVAVQPAHGALDPFYASARHASADFFPMFDTPFQFGRGWGAAEDDSRARVVVLSQELNQKLFAGADSTGRSLRLDDAEFRIVGVLKAWRPVPHFYDLNTGRFSQAEQVFLPFSTARDLKMGFDGSMRCWGNGDGNGDSTSLNAPCAWIQYWVQLDSAAKVADYRDYLLRYSEAQHAAGRFVRPPNPRLRALMEWLDFKKVVPSDVRLQVWLAFGFLLVCLVNTVGLLLAKCLRRSAEIGIRRALGASRRDIFMQFLVEAGLVGLAGGALGLLLALGGLWLVRQNPAAYAQLARLDGAMLLLTFVLALLASLVAGLLPAWRACQITPALQLKSQ